MNQRLTGIVVDDEQSIVETVSKFLNLSGFTIIGSAYNGCEASHLYEKCVPDFVVLDLKMPKYDGTYAIKEIKKMNPNAKIFVMTGYPNQGNIKNEVTAVLTKPYDLTELVNVIKSALVN